MNAFERVSVYYYRALFINTRVYENIIYIYIYIIGGHYRRMIPEEHTFDDRVFLCANIRIILYSTLFRVLQIHKK